MTTVVVLLIVAALLVLLVRHVRRSRVKHDPAFDTGDDLPPPPKPRNDPPGSGPGTSIP